MSEWWTYSLSDFLLFSARTYRRLFELYNVDIWPAQSVALALGCILLALMWRPRAGQGRYVSVILMVGWIWVAWAFHWRHFVTINWAATYFAYVFAFEALLLFVFGIVLDELTFEPRSVAHRVGFANVAAELRRALARARSRLRDAPKGKWLNRGSREERPPCLTRSWLPARRSTSCPM